MSYRKWSVVEIVDPDHEVVLSRHVNEYSARANYEMRVKARQNVILKYMGKVVK
jgi:hypothetical protein